MFDVVRDATADIILIFVAEADVGIDAPFLLTQKRLGIELCIVLDLCNQFDLMVGEFRLQGHRESLRASIIYYHYYYLFCVIVILLI